jgi:hypothetical protein
MTTTVDLANLPSTPTDVAVNFFTFANFKRTKEVVSDGGTKVQTYYRLTGGDVTKPTTILVTQRADVKSGSLNTTIRLETVQTVTVDDVVTEVKPVAVTIGLEAPGAMQDTADVLSLIGSVYSLWFKTVTSKVPNTGVIDSINIGVLNSLYG